LLAKVSDNPRTWDHTKVRKASRSALVPYSAAEMFSLVDDIEAYPAFLPWCSGAEVERRNDDTVVATLELHKGGLSKRFTTRNTRHEYSAIDIALVGGPFRRLAGGWQFHELDEGCRVSLDLEFAFDSKLVDMMFGAFFEETCKSLVDAFTRRAVDIYGLR
jgi:ribosome-associated toxin RatA of RatAB toxin-antitoxin module